MEHFFDLMWLGRMAGANGYVRLYAVEAQLIKNPVRERGLKMEPRRLELLTP